MTPLQLKRAATQFYGKRSRRELIALLAKDMKVNITTVYRWLDGTSEVPGAVEKAIHSMNENKRLKEPTP